MARFRATIQGNRGQASRLGTPRSGIRATINGWHSGVTVLADRLSDGTGQDIGDRFDIFATGGSTRGSGDQFLGTVQIVDGKPIFQAAA